MSGAAGLAAAKRRRAAGGGTCAPGGSCNRGSRKDAAQHAAAERRRALESNFQEAPPEVKLLYIHEQQLQRLSAEVHHLRALLEQKVSANVEDKGGGGDGSKIEA